MWERGNVGVRASVVSGLDDWLGYHLQRSPGVEQGKEIYSREEADRHATLVSWCVIRNTVSVLYLWRRDIDSTRRQLNER